MTHADETRDALEPAKTKCGPEVERNGARAEMLCSLSQNPTVLKMADSSLDDLETDAHDLLRAEAELKRADDAARQYVRHAAPPRLLQFTLKDDRQAAR